MPNYKHTCTICGEEFTTYNSTKETCSPACQTINHRLKMQARMKATRAEAKLIIEKICIICKKPFNTYKINNQTSCFACQMAKNKLPIRQYDETIVDKEGIIIGVNQK